MQFEPVILCRDADLADDEWTLIRVTRVFPTKTRVIWLSASVSGLPLHVAVPFHADLFRITTGGAESLLAEPGRFELEFQDTRPRCLAIPLVPESGLIPGEYFATLSIQDEERISPFTVEA